MTLLFKDVLSFKNWSHSTLREEEFTHSTFIHFIAQLGKISLLSSTWPHNPHDCGNSQPRLPPHTTPTIRSSNHSIASPETIQLPTRFDIAINKFVIHKTNKYKHGILINSPI